MKKLAMAVLFISVLVLSVSAGALAAGDGSARIKVPFAFYAGDVLIPAGTYEFSMRPGLFQDGTLLRIKNADGTFVHHVGTNRIEGNMAISSVQLKFNKYADSYFLSKILAQDLGVELSKSKAEKQIQNTLAQPKPAPGAQTRPKTQRSAK